MASGHWQKAADELWRRTNEQTKQHTTRSSRTVTTQIMLEWQVRRPMLCCCFCCRESFSLSNENYMSYIKCSYMYYGIVFWCWILHTKNRWKDRRCVAQKLLVCGDLEHMHCWKSIVLLPYGASHGQQQRIAARMLIWSLESQSCRTQTENPYKISFENQCYCIASILFSINFEWTII